ncbi:hypothetical protein [Bacillus sp. 3255]|nr:hypothetical protein [Bacillus sp. 3255]MDR6883076.1 hypothetical protein [Bacillus sp. 3255]
MEYRVRHMETGKEKILSHLDVNDMDYNDAGQVVIFDTTLQAYLLIDEE